MIRLPKWGLATDRNRLISINGPSASHHGSSLDGEQVGSKNFSLGRMMVGFSCREASRAFLSMGLKKKWWTGCKVWMRMVFDFKVENVPSFPFLAPLR